MNDLPKLSSFHVDHLIAEGGTAKVYWGIDLHTGFPVAIKELKLRHLNNFEIKKKFKEVETQLYLYMNHPNIPKLVDFVEKKETGQLFLIMEYVEGVTLEQYIYGIIGLIPEKEALPIFLKVLDTIEYIHDNGILHLDIKSNNVILQANGEIKIIDLGIASRMSDSTSTGFGTPAYMPPEQSDRGKCGRYTDIFALGIMLFEMLTGRLPYISDNPNHRQASEEIRNQIKYDPTPLMKKFYPPISDELQNIVEKALKKNPENRYQTCTEFGVAIKNYIRLNKKTMR